MRFDFIKKIQNEMLFRQNQKANTFKTVTIYADSTNNLYIVPCALKRMQGAIGGAVAGMDIVNYLPSPYSDELLASTLNKALEQCNTEEPKWPNGLTSMEQFLNVKGYAKAVKGKRLVVLHWDIDNGYDVVPTKKVPKQGYNHLEEYKQDLGKELNIGALTEAVKQALIVSTC